MKFEGTFELPEDFFKLLQQSLIKQMAQETRVLAAPLYNELVYLFPAKGLEELGADDYLSFPDKNSSTLQKIVYTCRHFMPSSFVNRGDREEQIKALGLDKIVYPATIEVAAFFSIPKSPVDIFEQPSLVSPTILTSRESAKGRCLRIDCSSSYPAPKLLYAYDMALSSTSQ